MPKHPFADIRITKIIREPAFLMMNAKKASEVADNMKHADLELQRHVIAEQWLKFYQHFYYKPPYKPTEPRYLVCAF